jgi:hypothetical protein
MDPDQINTTTLQAIFRSATRFGLSEEDAWRALDDCLIAVGSDATVAEYLDELAGALAHRILVNERDASRSAGKGTARQTG